MAGDRKVLICSSVVPFASGGAELLVDGLEKAVKGAGYCTEIVSVPYQWDPPDRIIKSCLIWRMLELDRSPAGKPDLLVATKFPTYAAQHDNKIAWVFHQHRSLYDLKDTIYDDLADREDASVYRELIWSMDRRFLSECRKVFAISKNVAKRLMDHCGVESEVVYHPPPFDGLYRSGDYGNDVLIVGRLEPLKRVDLAIKAMKFVRTPGVTLRIIGAGFLRSTLEKYALNEGVSDRVRFEGFVDYKDLLRFYAQCGCVLYVPYDEDYGYATLEAFKSRRPVVVTDDSGGVLEFVRDRENGRVVAADPREVAIGIDEMLSNKRKATRLGAAGFEAIEGITWSQAVDKLITPFVG